MATVLPQALAWSAVVLHISLSPLRLAKTALTYTLSYGFWGISLPVRKPYWAVAGGLGTVWAFDSPSAYILLAILSGLCTGLILHGITTIFGLGLDSAQPLIIENVPSFVLTLIGSRSMQSSNDDSKLPDVGGSGVHDARGKPYDKIGRKRAVRESW